MPGILPMKVIKVGSTSQSRIAQACDRCRSKKIRCDGVRPSCTQCTNVRFECVTSDKLSRRAFPRGYTESLEERVRALEQEIRELKDILNEKDEKIDVLAMIRSHPATSSRSKGASQPTTVEPNKGEKGKAEEMFKIVQSPTFVDDQSGTSYFMGMSSSRSLIHLFQRKLQDGRESLNIPTDAFFPCQEKVMPTPEVVYWNAPARLLSDQLVNIFLQEIAPLFPIIHRPIFLSLYEKYVACPQAITDETSLAQLNLVFAIAARSSNVANATDISIFESQWKSALEFSLMEDSLVVLQCLVLAQLCCLLSADYSRLLRYKGFAVGLSQRLGLHQSQKQDTFSALTSETRKKVFWTLYTLDCFSSAHLGLPTLISDTDVQCEFPADADDEYVTDDGYLSSIPGESTKLSSALALFRLARVLKAVLREVYPSTTSHAVPLSKITALQDSLDSWSEHLAPHLSLKFEMDKPSTGVISSRSPLISLAFHYTQTFITRVAVLASSSPATNQLSNSSIFGLASSSKCIVQIQQLLEERNLAFAFCLNKHEILLQSALCLLFQSLDCGLDSAVARDNAKLVNFVADVLERDSAAGNAEFRKLTGALTISGQRKSSRRSNSEDMTSDKPLNGLASTLNGVVNRSTPELTLQVRRATFSQPPSSAPQSSLANMSANGLSHSPLTFNMPQKHGMHAPSKTLRRRDKAPNLDYLSFSSQGPETHPPRLPLSLQPSLSSRNNASNAADWERMMSPLDSGQQNIYDGIYGSQTGGQTPSLADFSSVASTSPDVALSSASDQVSVHHGGSSVEGFSGNWSPATIWAQVPEMGQHVPVPQSVLSFGSDEGDDWSDVKMPSMAGDGVVGGELGIQTDGSPMVLGDGADADLAVMMDFGFGLL